MEVETALKEFGLSNNEIKVYLAVLSLGNATANTIGGKANLLRTTTYEILKSLISKGVASYVIKDKKKYFEVVDPESLINILEERKIKLKKALPELIKLKKSVGEKPSVELYEGKEGLKAILENLIKSARDNYKVIGNNHKFREILYDYYVESFVNKRLDAGISCEFIAEPGKDTIELKKQDKKSKRITKTMKELKNTNAELFIFGDKIAIFTLINDQPIGVLIREKNISQLMGIIFDKTWEKIRS